MSALDMRRHLTINQRLFRLGLYEGRHLWDPSKSDHDNRIHDLLDEVSDLRESLSAIRLCVEERVSLSGERERLLKLMEEADAEQ